MFTLLQEFSVDNLPELYSDLELEEAFRYKDKYILFFTENTPYEEKLTILLLDKNYHEDEKIELAVEYTPGIFNLVGVDEYAINFTFWSGHPMKLCYSEEKKYRWQFKNLISVSYLGGFFKKRHLTVNLNEIT